MEMTVVIAIIAMLAVLAAPATRRLFESFETEGGVRTTIGSALASARAIAAKEQRYAGIRFQLDDPNDPLHANQYIVFIVQDTDSTGLAYGFRAVEGVEPIKLPASLGVMDFFIVQRILNSPGLPKITEFDIDSDGEITALRDMLDTNTFSIVFSPSGKLIFHEVWVRNRDGIPDSAGQVGNYSFDDVFNKRLRVSQGYAMFCQDDYFNPYWTAYPGLDLGLGPEFSRVRFVIYEKEKFNQAYLAGQAYSRYLYRLIPDAVYINPYTGTLVSTD